MTIRDRMQNGMLYTDKGEGLDEERRKCQDLLYDYNLTRPGETQRRGEILRQLLGGMGGDTWMEPPIHMAYGYRVHIGESFYSNFNLVIVDDIDVYIGDHVMMAPNVLITTTGHPVDPVLRRPGTQFSLPVHIGNDVWIGSNAVILPGITIGDNSVIGAGSVVTHDIPADCVAVGNPCRVMRRITDRDKEYYFRDRRVEQR